MADQCASVRSWPSATGAGTEVGVGVGVGPGPDRGREAAYRAGVVAGGVPVALLSGGLVDP